MDEPQPNAAPVIPTLLERVAAVLGEAKACDWIVLPRPGGGAVLFQDMPERGGSAAASVVRRWARIAAWERSVC